MEITEKEVEYFKKKVLVPCNISEFRFCEFHGEKSLKDYIAKDKQGMINAWLSDQITLRSYRNLVYEVLSRIPFYDLEKIIDDFTEIKEIDASECHAVITTNRLIEKFASERKYKLAYEYTKTPRWIILLFSPEFYKRSKEYILFIIAHEFAHRHLEHMPMLIPSNENPLRLEDEADVLSESWGFKKPKNWNRGKRKIVSIISDFS